jgi:hypothetical protein
MKHFLLFVGEDAMSRRINPRMGGGWVADTAFVAETVASCVRR